MTHRTTTGPLLTPEARAKYLAQIRDYHDHREGDARPGAFLCGMVILGGLCGIVLALLAAIVAVWGM